MSDRKQIENVLFTLNTHVELPLQKDQFLVQQVQFYFSKE